MWRQLQLPFDAASFNHFKSTFTFAHPLTRGHRNSSHFFCPRADAHRPCTAVHARLPKHFFGESFRRERPLQISVRRQVSHLSPGPDLPGRTLLLLTRLHRLRLGGAAETVVQAILTKLTPGLTVLVALSTGHQALKGTNGENYSLSEVY